MLPESLVLRLDETTFRNSPDHTKHNKKQRVFVTIIKPSHETIRLSFSRSKLGLRLPRSVAHLVQYLFADVVGDRHHFLLDDVEKLVHALHVLQSKRL